MSSDSNVNKLGSSAPRVERKDVDEKVSHKEVVEASELGRAAYVEAVGLDESVETTGKVSEVLNEDVSENQAAGTAVRTDDSVITDPAIIRERLLRSLPSEKKMKSQIEDEIKSEIKYLHRKALKMIASPSSMSFFEMANLMKKIRELKGILITLVKASFENLKTLWLRFVHGVM